MGRHSSTLQWNGCTLKEDVLFSTLFILSILHHDRLLLFASSHSYGGAI